MSDLTSFVELVRSMRAAQKNYFKNRTKIDMQRSINLERQVDAQLQKIPTRQPEPEQISLPTEVDA